MPPKKILVCAASSALGGMERRIEDEVRLLKGLGHEVVVATPPFAGLDRWKQDLLRAGACHLDWRPYKFIERGHWAAPFRWLSLCSLPVLRRAGFDFAHIAMPWNFAGLSMAYLLQRAGVPYVVGIHCKFGRQNLPAQARAIVRTATRGMVAAYAVSTPVAERFQGLYAGMLPDGLPLTTVSNGIDTARFRPDPAARVAMRQSLGLTEEQFTVMFCGRLDPMKRPALALRLFSELSARVPRARLLIVGDGPEMLAIRSEVTTLSLSGKVILTGMVPDTAPYYAASDCYVSTSVNQEGCPLAAAEALACGLPALVPDDDVFRSVYGGSDEVQRFDPEHPGDWVKTLEKLASQSDEERRRQLLAARCFAQQHLSKELMYRRLTAFYEEII